jgi:DNA-binding HxlR family transcriptional regulator
MSEAFPNELKQFIAQHVESLAQLEALLILRQNPDQHWQSAELAQRLYITPDMCEAILADLERRGFAARASDGKAYYYQSREPAVDRLIDDLATVYQQRRVAVITEIYSKPVTKVQTFADAFRLRREEP